MDRPSGPHTFWMCKFHISVCDRPDASHTFRAIRSRPHHAVTHPSPTLCVTCPQGTRPTDAQSYPVYAVIGKKEGQENARASVGVRARACSHLTEGQKNTRDDPARRETSVLAGTVCWGRRKFSCLLATTVPPSLDLMYFAIPLFLAQKLLPRPCRQAQHTVPAITEVSLRAGSSLAFSCPSFR